MLNVLPVNTKRQAEPGLPACNRFGKPDPDPTNQKLARQSKHLLWLHLFGRKRCHSDMGVPVRVTSLTRNSVGTRRNEMSRSTLLRVAHVPLLLLDLHRHHGPCVLRSRLPFRGPLFIDEHMSMSIVFDICGTSNKNIRYLSSSRRSVYHVRDPTL